MQHHDQTNINPSQELAIDTIRSNEAFSHRASAALPESSSIISIAIMIRNVFRLYYDTRFYSISF